MNKIRMKELIDLEQGAGFSDNIPLDGYTFFKKNSFIVFKISRIEDGLSVANIRYIYSDNKDDLISIIAYACNFWLGSNIKFIYYKEKKKAPYVVKTMNKLGFRVASDRISINWTHDFICKKCKKDSCNCESIEAYA